MRTRRMLEVGAACLVALAAVFAMPTPASAAVNTYISVTPQPQGPSRMVLDVLDANPANGTPVQLWERNYKTQQYWTIHHVGYYNGYDVYEFHSNIADKCLDMAIDGPPGNGTRVQTWTCSGGSNQRWYAENVSGGDFVSWRPLHNMRNKNLCLDLLNGQYGNGARLQVFTCQGTWNQRFNVY
ncbi:RICIN domain-containing protein [Catellatospora methionotrophica]|nr:RICIN domain-containing protein [Catellatospora methionotrophica]